MKELPTIDNREQAKKQQIVDSLLTNLESFRAEATQAFSDFTSKERVLLNNLEANGITSYKILAAWEDELKPIRHTLHDKITDEAFKKFIVNNFILDEEEISNKINQLISERDLEMLHNFSSRIYPIENHSYNKQRELIEKLLSQPELEIEQVKNHQINYILHKETADKNHITVVDSHSSLLKRIKAKSRIRSERKKTIRSEDERLLHITERIKELSAMNGGLLVDIFDKKWDLMVILSLRNSYEKKVGKLSLDDTKNAVKRLAIFDAETQDFKNKYIEKMIIDSDQASLETTRMITKNIDSLLLRIFDLTTIQKNQLLLYTKKYRELIQEQSAILHTKNNRYISPR